MTETHAHPTIESLPTWDEIRQVIWLPEDPICAFASGAVVSGWAHSRSDFDLYVVTHDVVELPSLDPPSYRGRNFANVAPATIPVVVRRVAGRRWDVEFWSIGQIDQMIAKFHRDYLRLDEVGWRSHMPDDVDFVYRLSIAHPIMGADWLEAKKQELAEAPVAKLLLREHLDSADCYLEDAIGLLESGDTHAAVLVARLAFEDVVDSLIAAKRPYCPARKWRARQVSLIAGGPLDFEEYWRWETMRDLDPAHPDQWVVALVERCRLLMLEVSL